jgi:hypothetical protein
MKFKEFTYWRKLIGLEKTELEKEVTKRLAILKDGYNSTIKEWQN